MCLCVCVCVNITKRRYSGRYFSLCDYCICEHHWSDDRMNEKWRVTK